MSRGHGKIQTAILATLATRRWDPQTVGELAMTVYVAAEPTESQLVAVRRAVRKLAAEDAVVIVKGYDGKRRIGLPPPSRTRQRRQRYPRDGMRWVPPKET